MGLYDLFKRKPVTHPWVQWDETGVAYLAPGEALVEMAWGDLVRVEIHATCPEPTAEDVFWVLTGGDGQELRVPSSARGMGELMVRFHQLPGFDSQAALRAMRPTDRDRFLCWQRDPDEGD
jgi:hypothetical protein